jgi:hypothetical protein
MLKLSFRFISYFTKTLDELDSQFKSRQAKWKKSLQYRICVAKFKRMKAAGTRITNIVALGVGSLHQALGDGYSSDCKENGAMLQLAVLMTFREVLGGTSSVLLKELVEICQLTCIQGPGQPLPCTLQDPAYSKLEKQYLGNLG